MWSNRSGSGEQYRPDWAAAPTRLPGPDRPEPFSNICGRLRGDWGGYVGSRFAGAGTEQLDIARYVKLADSLPTALLCVQVAYANPTGRIVLHELSRRVCAHVTQPRPRDVTGNGTQVLTMVSWWSSTETEAK